MVGFAHCCFKWKQTRDKLKVSMADWWKFGASLDPALPSRWLSQTSPRRQVTVLDRTLTSLDVRECECECGIKPSSVSAVSTTSDDLG